MDLWFVNFVGNLLNFLNALQWGCCMDLLPPPWGICSFLKKKKAQQMAREWWEMSCLE